MNSVQKFNGLNGAIVAREELQSILDLALNQEQVFIAKRLGKLLQNNPDTKKFEIDITEEAIEVAPESLIRCLECEPTTDDEAEGLGRIAPSDIYQMITDKMIEAIKEASGKAYKKTWKDGYLTDENGEPMKGYLIPFNFVSKKPYRGINTFLLSRRKGLQAFPMKNPFFMTFKQIESLGGTLKKGSKAKEVVYFTILYKIKTDKLDFATYDEAKFIEFLLKNGFKQNEIGSVIIDNTIPILKYYNVFNGEDIENIDFDLGNFKIGLVLPEQKGVKQERIEAAELIVSNYPKPQPILEVGNSDRAFYRPGEDLVKMPHFDSFETSQDYYRTLFHEFIHSTGHPVRLDRDFSGKFGSKAYAKEELVAEFGAVFLSAQAGIIWSTDKNHAEYLKNWHNVLGVIKEDNRFLMRAASDAQKACDFILQPDKDGNPLFLKEILKKVNKKEPNLPKTAKSKITPEVNTKKKTPKTKVSVSQSNKKLSKEELEKLNPNGFGKKPKSASVQTAINDVLSLEKYKGIKPLVASLVYKHFKYINPEATEEPEPKDVISDYEKGVLKNDSKIHYLSTIDVLYLEPLGVEFVKAVNGRLDSLKNQKHNYALFDGLNSPLEISTDKFKEMTVAELRKFTFDYYKNNLKGNVTEIKNHLKEVVFITDSGRKLMKPMYKEKTAVIEHLEELIKNSTYNNWGDRKAKDNPTVLGYLNFKSKVTINGKKRHVRIAIQLNEKRETLFKSFDLGVKEKRGRTPEGVLPQSQRRGSIKPLSENKDTKNRINIPKTKNPLVIPMNAKPPEVVEFFKLPGDFGKFLGKVEVKPFGSVAVTLDAPQGAGKTRFFYQIMDLFASQGYRCLFVSLEEHPLSELAQAKKRQYIKPKNQALIDTVGELPDGYKDLEKLIPDYDVIFIDSWGKVTEIQKIDFDKSLRKKFNGKLFFVIFQRTVTGTMRGGSASQFDGDIIMKLDKSESGNYKENFAFFDKNRYQAIELDKLKFNIFSQKLIKEKKEVKPKPNKDE